MCRLERERALTLQEITAALTRFDGLWSGIIAVSHFEAVKLRAKRLLRVYPLRAADSLQLGAALAAASDQPPGWDFVCLDDCLRDAALREGFNILP